MAVWFATLWQAYTVLSVFLLRSDILWKADSFAISTELWKHNKIYDTLILELTVYVNSHILCLHYLCSVLMYNVSYCRRSDTSELLVPNDINFLRYAFPWTLSLCASCRHWLYGCLTITMIENHKHRNTHLVGENTWIFFFHHDMAILEKLQHEL